MDRLPLEIANMNSRNLEKLAQYHDKMAIKLRDRAKEIKQIEQSDRAAAEYVDFLSNTYKTVLMFIHEGHSLDVSIHKAADKLNLAVYTIEGNFKAWARKKDARSMQERDTAILALVQMGFTNEEIGQRLGIHPNSVCRCVKRKLLSSLSASDRLQIIRGNPRRVEKTKGNKP